MAVLVAIALVVSGCGSQTSSRDGAASSSATRASSATPGCKAAPDRWVRTITKALTVPNGRLRHAVIVGPAADVDLGFSVLLGKEFFIAAELDGDGLNRDGDVATWVIGDPYGDHARHLVIAADPNAYLNSRLGLEMYGTGTYADPTALAARNCVLRAQ